MAIQTSKYDYIGSFYIGFAAVCIDNKWGFIDRKGKEICEIKYDYVGNFHDGFAAIRVGDELDGKYGFIDESGKEICEIKYDDVEDFYAGVARVRVGSVWYLMNTEGKLLDKLK